MAVIRRALPIDAAPLADLAEQTFRDAFTEDNDPDDMELHCAASFGPGIQAREIEDPDTATIVADEDGALIGFAQVRLRSPKACVSAERPSELYRVYVSRRWHGQGVAQQIMREVLATVARAGSDRIWLGVWENNRRALGFYRKYGFEVVGEHVFQFGTDAQTDLIMAAAVDAPGAS